MWLFLFLLLLALILIALRAANARHKKEERGSCTRRTTATVIGHEETCLKDDSGADTWAFCPRFRFLINNTPVEATADWGTVNPRFHEGQHVTIYYDPDDPAHIAVDDKSGAPLFTNALVFFVIVFFGTLIMVLLNPWGA